jgi:hypothetical protein
MSNIEQALCRVLSASSWDETALEVLGEDCNTGGYEDPQDFVEDYCESVGVEYDPNRLEPLCRCVGCWWADLCTIKED